MTLPQKAGNNYAHRFKLNEKTVARSLKTDSKAYGPLISNDITALCKQKDLLANPRANQVALRGNERRRPALIFTEAPLEGSASLVTTTGLN